MGDGFGLFVFFKSFEETHVRNGVVKRAESKSRGVRKQAAFEAEECAHEKL